MTTAALRPSPAFRAQAIRPVEGPPVPMAELAEATWLLAPPDLIPETPSRPPSAVYIVLLPYDGLPASASQSDASGGAAEGRGDPIRIDVDARTAAVDTRRLDLPRLEFDLLAHLVAHPHRVYTRRQLISALWKPGWTGDPRTVDVHMARLRRKLGPRHRAAIATIRGVGYKYVPAPATRTA